MTRVKTRKERIQEENKKKKFSRNQKIASYVLAGTIATSAFITINVNGKEAAFQPVHLVQSGDTLYSLAKKYGVTVQELKEVNSLKSDLIKVGQTLKVPQVKSDDTNVPVSKMTHQVASGDTLFSIAKKYGVTVSHLKEINNLKSDVIKVGQVLELSNAKSYNAKSYIVASGDTLYSISKKLGVTVEGIKKENNLTSDRIYVGQKLTISAKGQQQVSVPAKSEAVKEAAYFVAPGDTLWGIANRFNVSVPKLKNDNNLKSEHVLIGQKLTIKGKNLVKANAVITGVVDHKSVEFQIEGEKEPIVLTVAYGTASNFELISGAKIKIIYQQSFSPALVELVFANESFH